MLGNRIKRIIVAVTICLFVAAAFICSLVFLNKTEKQGYNVKNVGNDLLCEYNNIYVPTQFVYALDNNDISYTYWNCGMESSKKDVFKYHKSLEDFKYLYNDIVPNTETTATKKNKTGVYTYFRYGVEMNNRILPVLILYISIPDGDEYKHICISNTNVWYYTKDVQDELYKTVEQLINIYDIPWSADELIGWGSISEFDGTENPYVINNKETGYTDDKFFDVDMESGNITRFNYEIKGVPEMVVIPKVVKGVEVKGIAYEAFFGYNSYEGISKIIIPDTVEILGDRAFIGCDKLNKIHFCGDIKYIGEKCFEGCISLKTITLPKGVSQLNSKTFKGCTSLSTVNVLGKVERVADDCFEGCNIDMKINGG